MVGEYQAPGDYICTQVGLHPLVVLHLQRSMHAPHVQIGPLSPLGETAQIQHFHRAVLAALDEAA